MCDCNSACCIAVSPSLLLNHNSNKVPSSNRIIMKASTVNETFPCGYNKTLL